ncbi:MAG: MBL fold metallo-hydrolase [Burkholderiaceae bacterium]|jgi:glyoxylase-like metal-dependent hydrolase (beta-lactamase superfamily II)|nr:MBL fold metallo-hydrolase [Burkholderiaceae bacterium]
MATITVFEAGYCTHPGCMVLPGAGLKACRFPARAYLIETPQGRWLWDTGYASHFLDSTRDGVFAWYRRMTPVHFDAKEAVAAQLRARGLQAKDLSAVILSHLHGDHIAGLRDLQGVPTWLSGAGWAATRSLRGIRALRKAFVPGLIPPDFESSVIAVEGFNRIALPAELAPFTEAYEAPGADGELLIVELPGHAAGHLGAFVATAQGWVLLASDAAWTPANYRERIGPSRLAHTIMDDARAYHDTLDRLHQLDQRGGARIWLTHEGAL